MVYPTSFVSKQVFPLANAIVNMGGQLGGAATPFIAGLLLDHFGWNYVFGFMSAISALTFVILMRSANRSTWSPRAAGIHVERLRFPLDRRPAYCVVNTEMPPFGKAA